MPNSEVVLSEQLNTQLEFERTWHAMVRSPLALLLGPVLGLISVILLWPRSQSPLTLSIWLIALTAIYAVRAVIRVRLVRAAATTRINAAIVTLSARHLTIVAFITGSIWGLLPWLPVSDDGHIHATVSGFVLAGVTAIAVTGLAAQRIAATAFIVPCVVPLVLKFLSAGNSTGIGMAVMALMYMAVSLSAVKQISSYFIDNGKLRLRSESDKAELQLRDKELRDHEAILEAIASSQSLFIQSDNSDNRPALFKKLLQDLLALTASEFGLIDEVRHDRGKLFLKRLAGDPSEWDEKARLLYEQHIECSLASKKVVIINDATHAQECFLSIPLLRGDEVIGIVSLASKLRGYSDAVAEYIDPVVQAVAQIVYAQRTESQRRASEQETLRTRAQLQTFIAYTPAAVAMVDRNLLLMAYSERWRKDFSLPDSDLHGASLYETLPDTPARWRDCHERALNGESEAEEADPYIGSDGRVRWFRWEVRPWYESADTIGGIVLFYEDVTETKRAIDTAHARERLLSKLTERIPGMLFQTRFVRSTGKLTLLYASNGSTELYGITPEDLSDDPEFLFRIYHPADKSLIDSALGEALDSGGIMCIEHRVIVPSKGERWVRVEASLERLADASYIWHGYVQDITERRRNEARLATLGMKQLATKALSTANYPSE